MRTRRRVVIRAIPMDLLIRAILSFVRRWPSDRSLTGRGDIRSARPLFTTSVFSITIGWMSLKLARRLKLGKDPTYVIRSQPFVIKVDETQPVSITGHLLAGREPGIQRPAHGGVGNEGECRTRSPSLACTHTRWVCRLRFSNRNCEIECLEPRGGEGREVRTTDHPPDHHTSPGAISEIYWKPKDELVHCTRAWVAKKQDW